jgi:hypothetical protein
MPLFGDKRDRGARSAAEREAARLERERRRALREGREPPEAPVDDGTGDAPADEEPPFEWDGPDADERDGGAAPHDAEREPDFARGRHGSDDDTEEAEGRFSRGAEGPGTEATSGEGNFATGTEQIPDE